MLMLKNEISSVVLLSIVGYMKMGISINFGLKYMVFENAFLVTSRFANETPSR